MCRLHRKGPRRQGDVGHRPLMPARDPHALVGRLVAGDRVRPPPARERVGHPFGVLVAGDDRDPVQGAGRSRVDGAGAAVIEARDGRTGLGPICLHTDGTGASVLTMKGVSFKGYRICFTSYFI